MLSKIIKNLITPWNYICYLNTTNAKYFLPDILVISCKYRAKFGRKLDLVSPKTFNEKLQWLKLYDRNPYYSKLVDKYEVKKIVAKKIGIEHVIPTYGVWNSAEEIDFSALPQSFVLKATHDSHTVIICENKANFDIEKAKRILDNSLANNYFYGGREWPYKNVKPRIIAEEYMLDSLTSDLRDYKFFCFAGEVKAMFIAADRQSENKPTTFDFFDAEYSHLDIKQGHPNAEVIPQKPQNFSLMKKYAQALSKDIPHVRVDFYEVNGKLYFGEMTFFHFGGLEPFHPDKWDITFGEWLELPISN